MSTPPKAARGRAHAERGAALLVAMVMIFLVSVLGISSMRGATLEGRLADNALQKEMTFQSAESATDALLAEVGLLESVICRPPIRGRTVDVNLVDAQETDADVVDAGRTNAVGFSLGGPVTARRFIVTGRSALPAVHTQTRVAQGVLMLGASDPTTGDC